MCLSCLLTSRTFLASLASSGLISISRAVTSLCAVLLLTLNTLAVCLTCIIVIDSIHDSRNHSREESAPPLEEYVTGLRYSSGDPILRRHDSRDTGAGCQEWRTGEYSDLYRSALRHDPSGR